MYEGAPEGADASPALVLDDLAGAARGLDALARTCAERVGVDRQRDRQLTLGEHLDGHVLAGRKTLRAQQLRGHLGARLEALLQRRDVDRLGVRPERLEGHRLL